MRLAHTALRRPWWSKTDPEQPNLTSARLVAVAATAFLLFPAPAAAQNLPTLSTVEVDNIVSSTRFKSALPFDVQFLITGTVPDGVQRLEFGWSYPQTVIRNQIEALEEKKSTMAPADFKKQRDELEKKPDALGSRRTYYPEIGSTIASRGTRLSRSP